MATAEPLFTRCDECYESTRSDLISAVQVPRTRGKYHYIDTDWLCPGCRSNLHRTEQE
jgi:uncharacterized protein with PIN domain